jgi:hypothetical protein
MTPGSYRILGTTGKSKERTPDKVKRGRPIMKKKRRLRKDIIHRLSYTEQDMKEAVRLVQEDGLTILMAAGFTNVNLFNLHQAYYPTKISLTLKMNVCVSVKLLFFQ